MTDKPSGWAAFTRENPEFPQTYHKLFQFTVQLIAGTVPTDDDVAGTVILELMAASLPDFDDILLLSAHDRHWGAMKLLRVLFERTVTLKYLAQNAAEVDAFLAFDAIDWDIVIAGIKKRFGLSLRDEANKPIQDAATTARTRFKQEKCKECGYRKQTTWTPHSSQELSSRTGLGHLHFEAFVIPSKFIHPTYFGTRQLSRNHPAPVPNTLKATHVLTLETVLTHQRYFKHDPLASPIVIEAVQDFLHEWKFADTDFGLGADAQRAGLGFGRLAPQK